MDELLDLSAVDFYVYQILVIDLAIAVAMISGLRFLTGLVANVGSADELSNRDNFAFGVAMAGGTVSLALMLTGVVSGTPGETYLAEFLTIIAYGFLGLILIKIGRLAQDNLVLRGIEVQKEISNGNLAAAFVDVANTIAIGLVLRAVMLWVDSDSWFGLLIVLAVRGRLHPGLIIVWLTTWILVAGAEAYRQIMIVSHQIT